MLLKKFTNLMVIYLMKNLIIKFLLSCAILEKFNVFSPLFLALIYLHHKPRVMKKIQVSCIGRIQRRSQLRNCVASSR